MVREPELCGTRSTVSLNSWISQDSPASRFLTERLNAVSKTDLLEYLIVFGNHALGDVTKTLQLVWENQSTNWNTMFKFCKLSTVLVEGVFHSIAAEHKHFILNTFNYGESKNCYSSLFFCLFVFIVVVAVFVVFNGTHTLSSFGIDILFSQFNQNFISILLKDPTLKKLNLSFYYFFWDAQLFESSPNFKNYTSCLGKEKLHKNWWA